MDLHLLGGLKSIHATLVKYKSYANLNNTGFNHF